jgi:hypothetical protein
MIPYYNEGAQTVNWDRVISDISPSSDLARLRQMLTGQMFDTQFQLNLFINDLRVLYDRGWNLPWGLTIEDLNNIEDQYTKPRSGPSASSASGTSGVSTTYSNPYQAKYDRGLYG